MSVGECHNAVRRLALAGLLSPETRRPVRELLTRFLLHGVPHAFPPVIGPPGPGVQTALAAPVFTGLAAADERYVWPDAEGPDRGLSLLPLYPAATRVARSNRRLYDLLAIVDTLRVGRPRERKAAEALLRELLHTPNQPPPDAAGS